jgi:hypothetical protein
MAMKNAEYYSRKLSEVNFLRLLCDDITEILFYEEKAAEFRQRLEELAGRPEQAKDFELV